MSSKFSTNVEGKIHEIRLDAKKGYQALFEVINKVKVGDRKYRRLFCAFFMRAEYFGVFAADKQTMRR